MSNTTKETKEELLLLQIEAGTKNLEVEMTNEQAWQVYHQLRELLLY